MSEEGTGGNETSEQSYGSSKARANYKKGISPLRQKGSEVFIDIHTWQLTEGTQQNEAVMYHLIMDYYE